MTGGAQRDGQGIERARADIAEHDAGRGEREEPGIALMVQFAAVGRIGARSRGRDVAGRSFHRPISLTTGEACGRSGPQTFQQSGCMRDAIVSVPCAAVSLTMSWVHPAPLVCHCQPGTCAAERLFPCRSRSPASLSAAALAWVGPEKLKTQAFATLSARPSPGAIVADLRRGGIAPSEKWRNLQQF